MFSFLMDADNYDSRAVARYEQDGVIVDTAAVSDGDRPYETGIKHPEYNDNTWIIVEAYDTTEEAKAGHEEWVKIMTAEELPENLTDCQNSEISQLSAAFLERLNFPRKPKAK